MDELNNPVSEPTVENEPTFEPESNEQTGAYDELLAAIKQYNNPEPEPTVEEPAAEELTPEPEVKPEPETTPVKEEPTAPVEEKKVQTPEENARFAEERRQRQIQERVQEEINKLKQEAPEFKIAQTLSEMYGRPVEQIMAELQEARLQKEATDKGVPVEVIKQIEQTNSRAAQLENQLATLRFQQWEARLAQEEVKILEDHPYLTKDQVQEAKTFMLQVKNPEMPLEQAVMSVHGSTIMKAMREQLRNELLAEQAGRGKSPLTPTGVKPASKTVALTDDERAIAKVFNMSEEDYMKFKS